ncbi:MAG: hypothetical protein KAX99_03170 [Azonexus sp.]|jgi:hypothetical protein|nr:hypothetical protein [Azonexus sp.]
MLRTGELFDQLTLRLPLEAYRPLLQCHTLVNGEFVEKVEAFRRHGYELRPAERVKVGKEIHEAALLRLLICEVCELTPVANVGVLLGEAASAFSHPLGFLDKFGNVVVVDFPLMDSPEIASHYDDAANLAPGWRSNGIDPSIWGDYPSYWMRMSAPFASDADIEALTDIAGEALYVEL